MPEGLRVSPDQRTDDIDLWLSKIGQIYREDDADLAFQDKSSFSKRFKIISKYGVDS